MRRFIRIIVLIASSAVAAGGATATEGDNRDIVEMQIPTQGILDLMRGEAQRKAPCPEEVLDGILLDHVEFPATDATTGESARVELDTAVSDIAIRGDGTTVPGHGTRVVLPTVALLKPTTCADDPQCSTPGVALRFNTQIDLALDLSSGTKLCASFGGTTLGGGLKTIVEDELQQELPQTCKKLDAKLDLDSLKLSRSGSAISTDGARLAIRFAYAKSATANVGDFGSFFDGVLAPNHGQPGTTLFVAKNLFTDFVDAKLLKAMKKADDFTDIESEPSSNFLPNVPGVHTEAWADTDPCSVDIHLMADMVFTLQHIGGEDFLVSDVTDSVDFNETAFGACIGTLIVLAGLPPIDADVATASIEAIAASYIDSAGVGTQPGTPVYSAPVTGGTDGKTCKDNGDCAGGICVVDANLEHTCFDPQCHNGYIDGDESFIDCGGDSCEACDTGDNCQVASDCDNGVCSFGIPFSFCAAPTCNDGVRNGTESDVDCGDSAGQCPKCGLQKNCAVDSNCASGICDEFCDVDKCTPSQCIAPSCVNGVRDGDEELADCGGSQCGPCPDCFRVDDHHIRCFSKVDVPALSFGDVTAHPTLDVLQTGEADGLVLSGAFPTAAPPAPTPVTVDAYDIERRLGFSGDCHGAIFEDNGYVGWFDVDGASTAHMCGVPHVVAGTDPNNVFSISGSADGNLDQSYEATLTAPDGAPFWNATYDMTARVDTNAGALAFTLGAPDAPTSQQALLLAHIKAVGDYVNNCYLLVNNPPYPGHYDPHWDVDPAYDISYDVAGIRGTATLEDITLLALVPHVSMLKDDLVQAQVLMTATMVVRQTTRAGTVEVFRAPFTSDAGVASFSLVPRRDGVTQLALARAFSVRSTVTSVGTRTPLSGTASVTFQRLQVSNAELAAR